MLWCQFFYGLFRDMLKLNYNFIKKMQKFDSLSKFDFSAFIIFHSWNYYFISTKVPIPWTFLWVSLKIDCNKITTDQTKHTKITTENRIFIPISFTLIREWIPIPFIKFEIKIFSPSKIIHTHTCEVELGF